jgi:hypothetical protein
MTALRRWLTRNALRRGLLDGNRAWMTVGVLVFGARFLRRLAKPTPKLVFRQAIQPGETLIISQPGAGTGPN